MSYCGYIVEVKELKKHSNADRLQVATVFGNDVIVSLDVQLGDRGVYFPTDGKLGLEYAKENNLLRKDENGFEMGGYLDYNKRHISSLKLRGEKSDGLLMPINSLSKFTDISKLNVGDTITTLGNVLICEKYVPKSNKKPQQESQNKKKKAIESYPFFEQHIDTSQLAYNTQKFKEGDLCYISLKLHGTSQRTSNSIKKMPKTKLNRFLEKIGIGKNKAHIWEIITGTRRVVLRNFEGGYYGSNEFRKNWHDLFEGKLQKGETVYYEVVGYMNEGKLIMPECSNKKTGDKSFVKKYGDTTRFTYGCGKGDSDIYVYRMTMTNEDGHTVEYPTELVNIRCEQMGVKTAPLLDKFIFTTVDDLMERVKKHEDGEDPIGKTHIREGVIVRIDNKEKFTAYKQKCWDFKVLEGIVKSDDVLDIEEAESVESE